MKKLCALILSASLISVTLSAQCAFVGATQAVGSSSAVTLTKPSAVVQNDLMIAAIHVGWCNSGGTISAPAGWTLIANTSNTGSGCGSSNTTIQLATFYKIAGPSEPMVYVFTGNSNQYYVGGIVAYSGVNTTTPIDVSSNNGAQDACANIVANGVFTSSPNKRLVAVFFCSVNNSATNIVPQNSLTERVDVSTTGNHPWGNENLEISDELQAPPGPTGNKTAALSGCSSTGWVTGAQLIALNCGPTTGIQEISLDADMIISPNPGDGHFEITFSSFTARELEVFDMIGNCLMKETVTSGTTKLDLSNHPKGIYFIRAGSSEGTITKKVVIR